MKCEWIKIVKNLIKTKYGFNLYCTDYVHISKFVSKYFKCTLNNCYEAIIPTKDLSLTIWIFIVKQNNNFPLIEILYTNKKNLHFYNVEKKHIIKKISPNQIKDLTDLEYYLKGIKYDINEANMKYDYNVKENKRKQRLYDIISEKFEFEVDEWAKNLIGFEVHNKNFNYLYDDFFDKFSYNNNCVIQIKTYTLHLKHKNILFHFNFEFTVDYKIKYKLNYVELFNDEDLNTIKFIPITTTINFEKITNLNIEQIKSEAEKNNFSQKDMDKIVDYYTRLYNYSITGTL